MRQVTLRSLALAAALPSLVAACSDHDLAPTAARPGAASTRIGAATDDQHALADEVRRLAAGRGVVAMPHRPYVRPALSRLGQLLFFDRTLSGPRNMACATCHLPAFATGDGRSLSVGQGGTGLGPDRLTAPAGAVIPRNAPPLFNLAAMNVLFWDGRVQRLPDGHVATPAGAQLTAEMQQTLEYGPASALALFPVTSRAEMRGSAGNELAAVADTDFQGIWRGLMRRLGAIPEYRALFEAAYPGTRFERMTFAHASNAIGGFMVDRMTHDDTPWDRFLAGDDRALTPAQLAGARDFMSLKCSICHTGATLSDNAFHDVAVAQIGPGEGDGAAGSTTSAGCA